MLAAPEEPNELLLPGRHAGPLEERGLYGAPVSRIIRSETPRGAAP